MTALRLRNLMWAFLLLAAPPTFADRNSGAMTGGELLALCRTERLLFETGDTPFDEMFCHGYIQGVHDAFSDGLCVPPGTARQELAAMTMKVLESSGEVRPLHAASIVFAVLSKEFPCPG